VKVTTKYIYDSNNQLAANSIILRYQDWQGIANSDSNGQRKIKNSTQLAAKAASVVSTLTQQCSN